METSYFTLLWSIFLGSMRPVSSFFGAASCVSLNETAALIYLCVKDTGYGSKAARGHACLREATYCRASVLQMRPEAIDHYMTVFSRTSNIARACRKAWNEAEMGYVQDTRGSRPRRSCSAIGQSSVSITVALAMMRGWKGKAHEHIEHMYSLVDAIWDSIYVEWTKNCGIRYFQPDLTRTYFSISGWHLDSTRLMAPMHVFVDHGNQNFVRRAQCLYWQKQRREALSNDDYVSGFHDRTTHAASMYRLLTQRNSRCRYRTCK